MLGVAGRFVRRGRDFTFRYSGNRRLRFRDGTDLFRGDVLKKRPSSKRILEGLH
jgi:hypothetical protein